MATRSRLLVFRLGHVFRPGRGGEGGREVRWEGCCLCRSVAAGPRVRSVCCVSCGGSDSGSGREDPDSRGRAGAALSVPSAPGAAARRRTCLLLAPELARFAAGKLRSACVKCWHCLQKRYNLRGCWPTGSLVTNAYIRPLATRADPRMTFV